MKVRIDKIVIVHAIDTDPDTSYLGEYSEDLGPADRTIDRKEKGCAGRHEYRYFIAAISGAQSGNPESVEQDYRRMESLRRGDWYFVGIHARAKLSYGDEMGDRRDVVLESGGLRSVESDSDADYYAEIEAEELADLQRLLEVFGVDCSNFDELAEKAEHKEN